MPALLLLEADFDKAVAGGYPEWGDLFALEECGGSYEEFAVGGGQSAWPRVPCAATSANRSPPWMS